MGNGGLRLIRVEKATEMGLCVNVVQGRILSGFQSCLRREAFLKARMTRQWNWRAIVGGPSGTGFFRRCLEREVLILRFLWIALSVRAVREQGRLSHDLVPIEWTILLLPNGDVRAC